MPVGLITSRSLQNESTGIDLQVPQHQEIHGAMMTGHVEYLIIVVTRIASFKSAKHKPGDVVQFVVSKKFSEIDGFYQKLIAQYPSVCLPPMPRKALFVGETDILERRAAFDKLVKFIAKHSTLATSPELLEFLGADNTLPDLKPRNVFDCEKWDDDEEEGSDFFSKDEDAAVGTRQSKAVQPIKLSDQPDDEFLDPLGGERAKKLKKANPEPAPKPEPKPSKPMLSLFEDEEGTPEEELFTPVKKHGDLKLFEDPDLGGAVTACDSLLIPEACRSNVFSVDCGLEENVDELFRLEEDLGKLLSVSKAKPKVALKPKPGIPPKPLSLSQSGRGAVVTVPDSKVQAMDQMDILRYIQQNEAAASDDLDLF
ncbi:HCLS1-binding protein 3 [Denticeps clupeoides]|uniref:PX domain-containing protein n=1 Tax=Denticeps clupeoides TaxID=299321 RepID=A0AAY4AHI8_9TELE|nr:HCLS1-binding protein 3 [Denticeps clupeoides]